MVEASIVARLLGIRLLTLNATVVVVPADVTAPPSAPHDAQPSAPARRLAAPPARFEGAGGGGGLAEAVKRIEEGAAILAEARRIAPESRAHRAGAPR